jgi:hypothetical protein
MTDVILLHSGASNDLPIGKAIRMLEEKEQQLSRDIETFRSEFSRLVTNFDTIRSEFSRLVIDFEGYSAEVRKLRSDSPLRPEPPTALSPPPPAVNSPYPSPASPFTLPPLTPPLPPPPSLGSQIILDFPDIFAEFRGKQIWLLWRGSRDGFSASEFHRRCDGKPNTLIVILDTKGNIFGGFTPTEWESRIWNGKDGRASNLFKADNTQSSFLFTVKNPNNIPPRKFPLKTDRRDFAIVCDSKLGPHFSDIGVSDHCRTNSDSYCFLFGNSYTNDIGMGGNPPESTFLCGGKRFRVSEIEVFMIKD